MVVEQKEKLVLLAFSHAAVSLVLFIFDSAFSFFLLDLLGYICIALLFELQSALRPFRLSK